MRVALFTDTYPPQVNGVARTLSRLVAHLARRGHQVALISPDGSESGAPSGPSPELHLRIPGIPLPLYPELLLSRPPNREEREALEAFDPQLVHCATESVLGWWGRRWALRRGTPLVTSFHTLFPDYAAGYGLGFARKMTWAGLRRFHAPARRTLVPSGDTVERLRNEGFHPRLDVWSRGVELERFHPGRRALETRRALAPGAEVILLYVGRLAPEKRLPLLLEAFRRVRVAASVEVGLVLVGGGPLAEELARSRPPGVHLAGYLEGEALGAAYASADLFAFPSDSETFGNVVLEAMAAGLPVVGVDRGGVRDSIRQGETGILTPPGEVEDFAQALLALVEDPMLRGRMGAEGRRVAESRPWPRILDGVVDTYLEVSR